MKILVTGASGFIGRNLLDILSKNQDYIICTFNSDSPLSLLDDYLKDCDFVFNFAAVHRPKQEEEFKKVNCDFFELVLKTLEKYHNNCPVVYTSSIQSHNGSLYGESKFMAEELLRLHAKKMESRAIIYRLTNVFGKWARPNAHSVVATFCNNVATGIPLTIIDPNIMMHFAYIDDVISSFVCRLKEGKTPNNFDDGIYSIEQTKLVDITLGDLAKLVSSFEGVTLEEAKQKYNDKEYLFYLTYISYVRS